MKSHWLITLSLALLLAMACSKDEEATEESPDSGEPAAPPAENTEPITPSEPENTETNSEPSTTSTNATSFPIPNPSANLPVGKQRDWTYGTGQPADLDRFYLNQAVNVLTNVFGLPASTQAQAQNGIWFYDQMKVDYMGRNYSKINVIIQQGRVMRLTIDPRSAVLGDDSGDPDDPSPTP